jgi:3HB-oligomer hydrolase 3HBOH
MAPHRAAPRAPRFLIVAALLGMSLAPAAARAAPPSRCDVLLGALGPVLADATCFESGDLTTNNPATTPANNSLAGLPAFAFTPQTDRNVISPDPPNRTPITKAVPGVQLDARIADDPAGEARFLLRIPNDWNGSLVVAGASGTRSEFNGDFGWSDLVVQKGYAYASQNKGVLNFFLAAVSVAPPADPLACRLNPASPVWVHFYDDDPGKPFTQWGPAIVTAAGIARDGLLALEGRPPRYTYAVGTSNGGYQVRRALELAPHVFDGGVDWEGTFVQADAPNILTDLPAAIRNFPAYAASGFDPASAAAQSIVAAGYPPDVVAGAVSLWNLHNVQFWEVTQCQWQRRLDPTYDTYGSGTGAYDYVQRASQTDVAAQLAAFANTGELRRPLITVAGTLDSLLPIEHHARAYARLVAAVRAADAAKGREDDRHAPYRLYEVQNGNHIETFRNVLPQLEFIQPHAQRAFELLVSFVEDHREPLPPDQCIPHGGAISAAPEQPGHCKDLFVPSP